ncbi:DNA sulfur modification protein DndD [Psychroflexus montanilacus]|uniref:DNA sulfur modification protein DndD n=1 Tax=Psychroflexus montanilacus TaxID=2873598 RepID=UPI001CC9C80E|nr:DNA sulfur modification protein DndD [Psychroflexus montanilacus]MBZ9650998.1 DNA sulfur modification protein DndD [Psychroflexus montanilacus]
MRIDQIEIKNFRIYKGSNSIDFKKKKNSNIYLIAGKNGFGKTSFLTSLVWVFYGRLIAQVEDKYRKDIKKAGGYQEYLDTQFNNEIKYSKDHQKMEVNVTLSDVLIPSVPCKTVEIKRTYDFETKEESLQLLIDGSENELTKEVGYEVFINDFLLPREIAKFFFFDAEKIVSLAEAKSKAELRSLSRAYSEVLGIKKYEELRKNLETLLSNLRRRGVSEQEKDKLQDLIAKDEEFIKLIDYNQQQQDELDFTEANLKAKSDELQEKLIREGNSVTLEELKALKQEQEEIKKAIYITKEKLKKHYELLPFLIASEQVEQLKLQLDHESKSQNEQFSLEVYRKKLEKFSEKLKKDFAEVLEDKIIKEKLEKLTTEALESEFEEQAKANAKDQPQILLDFTEEEHREFLALYKHLQTSFKSQIEQLVQEEKNNRINYNRVSRKIKQGEARKDNHLAKKLREEKKRIDEELAQLKENKHQLVEEFGSLNSQQTSHKKVLSEFEKNFNLIEQDLKKYKVTENLLDKIKTVISRVKEEKKFALQKTIVLGLKRLMHKDNFVKDVHVNIREDVMDIDLIDQKGNIIDKDNLSKGEQQLYATALLKALVDESGIEFPVFIDSPLQKFDKDHSRNIIQEFYPNISNQVVLFPLLEKELTEKEYDLMKPNLSQVYMIKHSETDSAFHQYKLNQLFKAFKEEDHVYTR